MKLFFIVALICISQAAAQNSFKIEDAALLTGTWTGKAFGASVEEIWSQPKGKTITGMFRIYNENKTSMLEYLIITETTEGVMMRFKHYNSSYVAKEDNPLEFDLVEATDARLVFDSGVQNNPRKIIYDFSGKNDVTVTVEGEKEGKPDSFSIEMTRTE